MLSARASGFQGQRKTMKTYIKQIFTGIGGSYEGSRILKEFECNQASQCLIALYALRDANPHKTYVYAPADEVDAYELKVWEAK